MTREELENLRPDSSVTWMTKDTYRLAGNPPWMTRRVPQQLTPKPPDKKETAAEQKSREMHEQMASYEGSPQYQAMLERNCGVAPGQTEPRSNRNAPSVYSGPRGGKYTNARTKDGRPYRRYF